MSQDKKGPVGVVMAPVGMLMNDINNKVHTLIADYAKKHRMSYEEAASRARIKIGDHVIEPIANIEVNFKP